MKKYIRNNEHIEDLEPIESMAIINPRLCRNLTIQVEIEQRDEGPIPHVHVYHDKTRNPNKCSYVRLDLPEYSYHHKDNIPLPSKLKKEFIEVMTSPWSKTKVETPTGVRYQTGYEAAVYTWVDTFESEGDYSKFNLDEHGELIQPDYNKL